MTDRLLRVSGIMLLALALVPATLAAQGKKGGGGGGKGGGSHDSPPPTVDDMHQILVDANGGGVVAIYADGSHPVEIVKFNSRRAEFASAADWSPPSPVPGTVEGNWIAYAAYGRNATEPGLHFVNVDGTGEEHWVPGVGGVPVWSPTGAWIALNLSLENGYLAVQILHVSGLVAGQIPVLTPQECIITYGDGWSYAPTWSPDGSQLAAYFAPDAGFPTDVIVWDWSEGTGCAGSATSLRALYPGLPDFVHDPAWSKQHADWMVVNADGEDVGEQIWFIDPSPGGSCGAVMLLGEPRVYYRPADWSWDDGKIVFDLEDLDNPERTGLWTADIQADENGCVMGVENLERIGDWPAFPPRWRRAGSN